MPRSEIVLHCVRLFLGGVCSFAAIALCAKRRSAALVCLAAFVLFSYARSVYLILLSLGIVVPPRLLLFGVPPLSLAFEIVPQVFLFMALIFLISRGGGDD